MSSCWKKMQIRIHLAMLLYAMHRSMQLVCICVRDVFILEEEGRIGVITPLKL